MPPKAPSSHTPHPHPAPTPHPAPGPHLVQLLELLAVLGLRVHLDLQRVNFQQLRPLLQVVLAFLRLARPVQLPQHLWAAAVGEGQGGGDRVVGGEQ